MTFISSGAQHLRLFSAAFALVFLLGTTHSAFSANQDHKRYASPQTRLTGQIDENDRVTLTHNRHPKLNRAQDMGLAEDSLQIDRMILSLSPDANQKAALDQFLLDAHNPASPQFGQWLTPQEFEKQFGVSDNDIKTVTRWLTSHGFTVNDIPTGHRSIVFSGSAQQIRNAFHTQMRRFKVDNEDHIANATDPEIPEALSAVVNGVVSLHNFHSRPMRTNVKPMPQFTNGTSHSMSPADFYTIYNLKPVAAQSINGSGRTIAILGRTNILTSDIQQFQSTMGLPANLPQIIVNGANPGRVSGDEGESDLDLEWAGAIAPAATVKFVTSKSTTTTDGIDLSVTYAVSNNVADIISLSYGLCEADLGTTGLDFYNSKWQQAAAQGISVFVSAGDSGAADCDSGSATTATRGKAINGLCSSPYSTCVGGTQFNDTANPSTYWASTNNANDQSSALSYIPEVVWNESGTVTGGSGLWAGGGGVSTYFAKPSWQSAPGVPNDGKRDVPDVSLTAASHDGYRVYSSDNTTSTQTLYVFGGTSASAPSFAGIMALINQKTGYRQGNANPRFYQLANSQANGGPAYFHLITSGNNSVPGQAGFSASTSTPYYNLATGLGSVDGNVLVNHWTDALPSSTTTLNSSTTTATIGQNITLTATVAGSTPTGTVQFKDGTTNLGNAVTLSNGVAMYSTTALALGAHTITASYSGDVGNNASASSAISVTVTKAPSAISLSSSNTTTTQGQSITLSATLSGKLISGTVQFMDGATSLGTVTINNCVMTFTTSALSVGTHNITAIYSGDGNNLGSTSAFVVQTVNPAITTTSTALNASSNSVAIGQNVTLTATITGSTPTGTVQFKDGATDLGSPVMLSGNVASLVTNNLALGSHSITAAYSGDSSNTTSTSSATTVTVTQAIPSVNLTSTSATATQGDNVTLSVSVNGYNASGPVQFLEGSTVLGSATLSGGVATFPISSLTVGTHNITASYAGDSNNAASVSSSIVVTVSPAENIVADGDAPTLPEWAAILMGLMLMVLIQRRAHGNPRKF